MNLIFSAKLKQLRKEKKLLQSDLAELLGTSVNTISSWECARRYPSLEMMKKLSAYFDTSIAFLEGNSDEPGSGETATEYGDPDSWDELVRRIQLLSEKNQSYLRENIKFVLGMEHLL